MPQKKPAKKASKPAAKQPGIPPPRKTLAAGNRNVAAKTEARIRDLLPKARTAATVCKNEFRISAAIGVPQRTLRNWRAKGAEQVENENITNIYGELEYTLQYAHERGIAAIETKLYQLASDGDLRAMQIWLAAKCPNEYGNKPHLDDTSVAAAADAVNAAAQLLKSHAKAKAKGDAAGGT